MEMGAGAGAVKLVLRGSLAVPVLSNLGNERRFRSIVEAGDLERGGSRNDMDTARLVAEGCVAGVSNERVGG